MIVMSFIYACAHTTSIVREHPVEVTSMPDCGDCHEDKWKAFSHKAAAFYKKHGEYAKEQKTACNACHAEAFCSDCHANKSEIKPGDKFYDSPERNSPHRGDYLSLHRIDGKINPASCAKCHGRQNNDRCVTCHR